MKDLKIMADEELVILYAKGNEIAFNILLDRYRMAIYNYLLFLTHNKSLAEDLFQETIIKAITTIKQGGYAENGKFRYWIARIARNLTIDQVRVERNENTISNEEFGYENIDNAVVSDVTIEDEIIWKQTCTEINYLIHYLPERQREVLELHFYNGFTFREIAGITGVSINTALGRMRYALMNMRKIAEEKSVVLTYT